MNIPNIKTYLLVSGILIFIFLFLLLVPIGKKITTSTNQPANIPTPTNVQINNGMMKPTIETSQSTGVFENEQLPKNVLDASEQKQALRKSLPTKLAGFSIDFDYAQDRFIVTLSDPKDENKILFTQWKNTNYPNIGVEQFNFK